MKSVLLSFRNCQVSQTIKSAPVAAGATFLGPTPIPAFSFFHHPPFSMQHIYRAGVSVSTARGLTRAVLSHPLPARNDLFLAVSPHLRTYAVNRSAKDLKKGDVIAHKGSHFEVIDANLSRSGKRNAYVQSTIRHLLKHSRSVERFRVDETVTIMDVSAELMEVSEIDAKGEGKKISLVVDCINGDGETIKVDFTKLGLQSLAKYLQKGMGILVSIMEDEQVYAVRFPNHVVWQTADSQAWEKGGKTGDRLVDLVNGERIKAPHHVESGDYLVISLPDVRVMDVTKNK